VEWYSQGKTKVQGERNLSQCHFVHQRNPTWTVLWWKTDLHVIYKYALSTSHRTRDSASIGNTIREWGIGKCGWLLYELYKAWQTCGKRTGSLKCYLTGCMTAIYFYMLKKNCRLMLRSWCCLCLCVSETQRSNLLNDFPKYTVDKLAGSAKSVQRLATDWMARWRQDFPDLSRPIKSPVQWRTRLSHRGIK
jgi:hypothetical protein